MFFDTVYIIQVIGWTGKQLTIEASYLTMLKERQTDRDREIVSYIVDVLLEFCLCFSQTYNRSFALQYQFPF